MPNLPTLTVTDAQLSRITAAYGDAATYKAWLKQAIKDYVVLRESEQINADAQAQIQANYQNVDTDLGTMT